MAAAVLLFLLASDFQTVFRSGLLALSHNDLPPARAQLEQAGRIEPNNGQVWAALAQVYWKLHLTQLASTAAKRAERLSPHDPLVQHGLAVYNSAAGTGQSRALDTPQFNRPNSNLQDADFGRITGTQGASERRVQLSLRFQF